MEAVKETEEEKSARWEARADKYLDCADSEIAWKKVCRVIAKMDPMFFVESFESVFKEQDGSISATGLLHVAEILGAGKKVKAIKMFRTLTGKGLKESKEEVDAMEELIFGK